MDGETRENWIDVACEQDLIERSRIVTKVDGKQIALFATATGPRACDNRCPHEGYPLSEGSLSGGSQAGGCVLTCNWHNWKFDLETGETLVGEDRLRTYPVRIEDGRVWIEVSAPPAAERIAAAQGGIAAGFARHEYGRMARDLARLVQAGGDPLEPLRQAIVRSHDRFEYGMTHAHAVTADWLWLHDTRAEDPARQLVAVMECLGHLSWDSLREPVFPYPDGTAAYDPAALVAAIEAEDETAAVAQVRGALTAGAGFEVLLQPFTRAALAHYQDFGHAAIYVYKAGQLVARLGPDVALPMALLLARCLAHAAREDLIPEFKSYASSLAAWDGNGARVPCTGDFERLGVAKALALAVDCSGAPDALYGALLEIGARHLLQFDLDLQNRTDGPVSQNVGWLDFTHHITFANAVRALCTRFPDLWPQGLLQIACFAGRNSGFVNRELGLEYWLPKDEDVFLTATLDGMFDHGAPEYIVSAHRVKTAVAVHDEVRAAPDGAAALLAGLNRFLHSPLKRKHALRVANQSLRTVSLEG